YKHLKLHRPEAVITTGSHVAIPVCIAAKILGIPIELYELNVVPGKTIKFLAPLSYKIWICFEQSIRSLPSNKCSLTDYPIKFFDTSNIMAQKDALTSFSLDTKRKTIVVLGGSQGSAFINDLIKNWVEKNPSMHAQIQIIHQTGASTINWQ